MLRAGNRGLTLLEIIFVLFLIVLGSSVVFFSAGKLYDKSRFNGEARKLLQTIKYARELSLMERKVVEFKVDEEGNSYWIDLGNSETARMHSLPQKFAVEGETLIFFPKGNSSGGSIKINNGRGQEYTIEVDPVVSIPSI